MLNGRSSKGDRPFFFARAARRSPPSPPRGGERARTGVGSSGTNGLLAGSGA
jgi:hypothetical protein